MRQEFLGYHSEWNLGSPGGWDYQRMSQEVGKLAWKSIQDKAGLPIELDFNDPILYPVTNFAQLLLRASRNNLPDKRPFIALVAEEETLDKVGENIRFVEYLNSLPDVKAALIGPTGLKLRGEKVCVGDRGGRRGAGVPCPLCLLCEGRLLVSKAAAPSDPEGLVLCACRAPIGRGRNPRRADVPVLRSRCPDLWADG